MEDIQILRKRTRGSHGSHGSVGLSRCDVLRDGSGGTLLQAAAAVGAHVGHVVVVTLVRARLHAMTNMVRDVKQPRATAPAEIAQSGIFTPNVWKDRHKLSVTSP